MFIETIIAIPALPILFLVFKKVVSKKDEKPIRPERNCFRFADEDADF